MQSDVNTVCFADESGHLIYSGSDDNFCKVIPYDNMATFALVVLVMMDTFEALMFENIERWQ